ncbi:hypothetical protein [Myxacorys almedinensis]|uniref:Uncharacterized protein n=1 Tax=Myxacorys almedinensis A TaxID=2690445 RepID=A0A8J7Z370_9CYAN|nr:hypothetical protein [Myxacorys almedinensis]NDJ18445.1 hypothetical protein [Myxacorys almedinensis A]
MAHPFVSFGLAIAWGLVLAVLMMSPIQGLQRLLARWFTSDTVAFTFLIGVAAFASILLNWFKIFLPFFMIFSAESLARLDLQTAEFGKFQAVFILVATAWAGLGLGWIAAHLLY